MTVPLDGATNIQVSTPSLAFLARLVEAEEPVGVQAFGAELAVQAFDECVVGRLAGPAEVKCHTAHKGPQVERSGTTYRFSGFHDWP